MTLMSPELRAHKGLDTRLHTLDPEFHCGLFVDRGYMNLAFNAQECEQALRRM